MTSFKDKTAGAVMEIAGEVVGDAALAEERKKQRRLRPTDNLPLRNRSKPFASYLRG
jgi:hypothetical protein